MPEEQDQVFEFTVASGDVWGTLMVPVTGEFIRAEDGMLKVAVYNPATEKMDLSEYTLTDMTLTLTVKATGHRTTI